MSKKGGDLIIPKKCLAVFSIILIFGITLILPVSASNQKISKDFVHGILITVDCKDYYLMGPADGPNGEKDIPGHYWKVTSSGRLIGKHYNTGPFGEAKWFSSDAGDGELLYVVQGKIDTWSPKKAQKYAKLGYVHYHHLVSVEDGTKHPTKVVWLRHIAVTSFTFDGGHHQEFAHYVKPGVDFKFHPNYDKPYPDGCKMSE